MNLVLIAYASVQSRQNLRCSLIKAVSQQEPSDRKPDPWPLWMAGHAQLKFVITECSKTQITWRGPNDSETFTTCAELWWFYYFVDKVIKRLFFNNLPAEVYDPAKHVTDVLKGLCGSEQACEICLFKDEITSTLLSPISHFLDVAVSSNSLKDPKIWDTCFKQQTWGTNICESKIISPLNKPTKGVQSRNMNPRNSRMRPDVCKIVNALCQPFKAVGEKVVQNNLIVCHNLKKKKPLQTKHSYANLIKILPNNWILLKFLANLLNWILSWSLELTNS